MSDTLAKAPTVRFCRGRPSGRLGAKTLRDGLQTFAALAAVRLLTDRPMRRPFTPTELSVFTGIPESTLRTWRDVGNPWFDGFGAETAS